MIEGVFTIEPMLSSDERGKSFYYNTAFFNSVQTSYSYNKKSGTFRGMHIQDGEYAQAKLVTCSSGMIYDIVLDLRKNSKTYLKYETFYLNGFDKNMLHIPKGCAHGFLTLEDNSIVNYQLDEKFNKLYYNGFKWNDPAFKIKLPNEIQIISEQDLNWEPYEKVLH